jgi:thiopeptide-type bacteriocin biosynthesis protein
MNRPAYQFLPDLFLRSPYYSYTGYDLQRLPEVLSRPSFRNAVWLASPVFYKALEAKLFDFARLSHPERHTLAKYYNRMSFRPTPFGAFATFSLLQWGQAATVKLHSNADTRLHLLPDQAILAGLDRSFAQQLPGTLRINPTLYPAGKEYRFIRSAADSTGRYRFSLDTTALLPFTTELLAFVQNERPDTAGLSAWIEAQTGCPLSEADDYTAFLCQAQILTGPWQGSLTAAADRRGLHTDLRLTLSPEYPIMAKAGAWASRFQPPAITGSEYYAATELPVAGGSLDESTRSELGQAIAILGRFHSPAGKTALDEFKAAFQERYDRAQVPLMEALDPDNGLSYAGITAALSENELLHGIPFPPPGKKNTALEWNASRRLLFELWRGGSGPYAPIMLQDSDLRELPQPGTSAGMPPSTLAVLFRKNSGRLLIDHVGGACANALNGRFSMFSADAHRLCRDLARKEQAAHPDILFADIGQRSDEHADNINRRMQIYDFEIPLNVYSGLPEAAQLPPGDLLLSVSGGQLILASARYGKRVIPRLPSAYNFRRNDLAVYRLLCDLQYEGLSAPRNLDLEQFFPGLDFYPRVSYGRTILSLACWKFREPAILALSAADSGDALERLKHFRERHHLPQRISLGREDQQLVFDLTQADEAHFFLRCLRGQKEVSLREYLLPDRSVSQGAEFLAGQFIAYLYHDRPVYQPLPKPAAPQDSPVPRRFTPGSDWLYLKLYCTPRNADLLLTTVIDPVVRAMGVKIARWFFIRYQDTGYHLRLRFRLSPEDIGPLMLAIRSRLRENGNERLVNALLADTYIRELERYGPELIEQAEDLFHIGSDIVVALLGTDGKGGETRDLFFAGLHCAYRMLSVVFKQSDEAIIFTGRMADDLSLEFGGEKQLLKDLDRKYRSKRREIADALEAGWEAQLLPPLLQGLHRMMLDCDQCPHLDKTRLLADLIHMQLNRSFSDQARRQEFLVYYFLHKYLISKRARAKKQRHAP